MAAAVPALFAFTLPGCAFLAQSSVSSTAGQPNGFSFGPVVSDDGHLVAFTSRASNLVAFDSNQQLDIVVRDHNAKTNERVSLSTAGAEPDLDAYNACMSGDGRFVAFVSRATTLVAGDTNGFADVFLRDRQAHTTERVSVAGDGSQANGASLDCAISDDGRYVAFTSFASNLVAGDTNTVKDVFLRDRVAAITERVSVSSTGAQATNGSFAPSISDDGNLVTFVSDASDLVPGDTNISTDAFVRNRSAGTTSRVDASSQGAQANDSVSPSYPAAISGNGRFVAFASYATNLVAGDANAQRDVFVRDLLNGTTDRASVSSSGVEGNGESGAPSISDDGRMVAFASYAKNFAAADTNDVQDVYVRDRLTGVTQLASTAQLLGPGNAPSYGPSISGDGRSVAFTSLATNLSGATAGVPNVYLRAVPVPTVTSISPAAFVHGTTFVLTVNGSELPPNAVFLTDAVGVTFGAMTYVNSTQVKVLVTVDAAAPSAAGSIGVASPGTGLGTTGGALGGCTACFLVI